MYIHAIYQKKDPAENQQDPFTGIRKKTGNIFYWLTAYFHQSFKLLQGENSLSMVI